MAYLQAQYGDAHVLDAIGYIASENDEGRVRVCWPMISRQCRPCATISMADAMMDFEVMQNKFWWRSRDYPEIDYARPNRWCLIA